MINGKLLHLLQKLIGVDSKSVDFEIESSQVQLDVFKICAKIFERNTVKLIIILKIRCNKSVLKIINHRIKIEQIIQ